MKSTGNLFIARNNSYMAITLQIRIHLNFVFNESFPVLIFRVSPSDLLPLSAYQERELYKGIRHFKKCLVFE